MTAEGGDRPMVVRVGLLGAVVLLALLSVAEWKLPWFSPWRRGEQLELVIAAFDRGTGTVLEEALPAYRELRFAGTVPRRCNLFVFAMTPVGARRLSPGDEDAAGVPVGPGEFRLPGGHIFDATPGGLFVRFWAVCGGPDLRFASIVSAARVQIEEAGGPVDGLTRTDHIEGLPESTLQTSRLLRLAF